MKLAMYQMENAEGIQKNLIKSLNAIKTAAENGADLILFPEVQLTEFFPQYQGKDVPSYGLRVRYYIFIMIYNRYKFWERVYETVKFYISQQGADETGAASYQTDY